MIKDNFKIIKNIVITIIFIILIIIFFSSLFRLNNNKFIKNIKEFIESDTKIIYISNEKYYSNYPIELLKKYEVDYMYINSSKLTNIEKSKLEDIINSKYLSDIIVIFNNGKIVDAIIEPENNKALTNFFQVNNIIPEIIGDNSKIINSVSKLLETEYSLIYLPYKKLDEIENQNEILKKISKEYEINYKQVKAYLLSDNQKNKLNSILQISTVDDQIVILVRDNKIVGSIRGIYNKKKFINELINMKFIEENGYFITHINLDEFNKILNGAEKNVIIIGKDDCIYCDEVNNTLNEIAIEYDIKVNYINVGKVDSEISKQIKNKLGELGYKDSFAMPLTIVVEGNYLLDYIIGVSNEQFIIDILNENGIIR